MPRTRPHAKLHISLRYHPKTAAMYADNDMMAAYSRILMLALERFAPNTGGVFSVHDRELGGLFGKHRADVARKSLERLAEVSPISAERHGDYWSIKIPNLRKKQGFDSKNAHGKSPPEAEAYTKAKAEKKQRARAPRAPKKKESPCPEELSIEEREAIVIWAADRDFPHDPASLRYAWESFHESFKGSGTTKADWYATFQRAIRKGWVFEGLKGSAGNGQQSFAERDAANNEAEIRMYLEEANARHNADIRELGDTRALLPDGVRRRPE